MIMTGLQECNMKTLKTKLMIISKKIRKTKKIQKARIIKVDIRMKISRLKRVLIKINWYICRKT